MSEINPRGNSEVSETKIEKETYKDIKAESDISIQECDEFWEDTFSETGKEDVSEEDIEKTLDEYFQDLKDNSECPETIQDKPFDVSDLKQRTPEENAEMREEFDLKKAELKKQWEEENGRTWPKYDHDIYSSNGKLIRKAGSDYDAHHIQPLGMGGKNEAKNITPISAENHYDKQGVHSPNSPYSKLDKMIGEK